MRDINADIRTSVSVKTTSALPVGKLHHVLHGSKWNHLDKKRRDGISLKAFLPKMGLNNTSMQDSNSQKKRTTSFFIFENVLYKPEQVT